MRLLLISLFLPWSFNLYAQCDPVYKREVIADYLYPDFNLDLISNYTIDSAGIQLTMRMNADLTRKHIIDTLGTSRSVLHTRYANYPEAKSFIETAFSKDTLPNMGEGVLESSLVTPQGALTLYFTHDKKHNNRLYIYHAEENAIYIKDVPFGYEIGQNDTSVFYRTTKFKHEKVKYAAGTIVSVGINDSKIEQPLFKHQSDRFQHCTFYADPYIAYWQLYSQSFYDCHTAFHNKIYIHYNNSLTDSIQYVDEYIKPYLSLKNDTLSLVIYEFDTLLLKSFLSLYQLTSGQFIRSWKSQEWQEVVNENFSFIKNYRIVGSVIFVETERRVSSEDVTKSIEVPYVLSPNGLPFTKKGTIPIITAFDLHSNAFLGYPQISIIN